MARTALASQSTNGDLTFTAANADGHSIGGSGEVILLVDNASGSPVTVTVQTAATVEGLAVADLEVAVAAGKVGRIGPFRPSTYDRASGAADAGTVYVDFSAVATVTVAAIGI